MQSTQCLVILLPPRNLGMSNKYLKTTLAAFLIVVTLGILPLGWAVDRYLLKNQENLLFTTKSLEIGGITMAPFILVGLCVVCGCCNKNNDKVALIIMA